MGDLEDRHKDFLKKNLEVSISFSAFRALRSSQCRPVSAKSTHNVCVCRIHGNIRLKQKGLKKFLRKKFNYQNKYRDYLKDMICSNPSPNCYLGQCKRFPGAEKAPENLKATLEQYKIKSVSFNQWLTTDRYFILFLFHKHIVCPYFL